ncbi:MAG TPA: NAD(P)-dependent oxidoreductase [Chitinophagaceae bacterium]|nr:NAD(P)-dependent oxidoreductase [Chitinophagaceae bacterium]
MQIGFIGLGNLGTPIALNLLERTGQLFVYNRTASRTGPLQANGAVACESVAQLAGRCDLVFSMVADDAALNHISLPPDGIAAHLRPGGIHVSMSTVLPATASRLAGIHEAAGQHYVAAPVMGRPEAAAAKKLLFLASGPAAAVATVKPYLLQCGALGVWEFGEEVGAANVAKLCNNYLIASAIESMAEALRLARKSGLDTQQWMNMITQTLFNAPVYINYGNLLMKEVYEPASFYLRLGLKDVNLVLEQASTAGTPMPVAEQLKRQLDTCMAMGLGEQDWTAIARALDRP